MWSDEKELILRVVKHYAETGEATDDEVKVTALPDNKTSYVERNPDGDRSITLDEYHIDGKVIWAGFSTRAGTVYLSLVKQRVY
jgi:hypothetical protein